MRVSPFRHPRIDGYLLLPAAFRSLSRLSSALSAKASALCSFLLDHSFSPASCSVRKRGFCSIRNSFLSSCLRLFCLSLGFCKPLTSCFCLAAFCFLSWLAFLGCPDKTIYQFSLYEVFKVRFPAVFPKPSSAERLPHLFPLRQMEMERFELLTPCLQGRCSPN